MSLQRSVFALSRRSVIIPSVAHRNISFLPSIFRRNEKPAEQSPSEPAAPVPAKRMIPREEVKSFEDLLPPGAEPGTVPTDLEQATGLERLEILGKMQGIDIFDMKPLDSSRRGTLEDPIVIYAFGDEHHCGCTGSPADSHTVRWITTSRKRPFERCTECGSVYKLEYVGPPDDPNDHHVGYEEPKTFVDYVKPEYWYGKLTEQEKPEKKS